jgi:hypothetical protein
MSTVQTVNLKNAASVSNNIVLDASGNAAFAGNVTASGNVTSTGMVVPSSSFLRNRIINGDMRISQRNGTSAGTYGAGAAYWLDRWVNTATIANNMQVQQSTVAPAGFNNSTIFRALTGATIGSSDIFVSQQMIEGLNVGDLAWGTASAATITVSFWVRSSVTGTFGGSIRNGSVNRSYPFTYSIASADTWTYRTVTIPGDTTGTWATDNSAGLSLNFDLGSGSTFRGTAGTWAAANFIGATGSVSPMATNGATFYLTGVQLEVGTVATPFERRLYGQELFLCQRYFQRFSAFCGSNFDSFLSYFGGTGTPSATQIFPVQMRATPTGSFSISTVEYYSYAGVWTSTTLVAFPLDAQRFYFWCLTDGDGRGKLMRNSGNNPANQPYVSWTAEL